MPQFSPGLRDLLEQKLEDGRDLRANIRRYNNAFAMASLSAKIELPRGSGPYCFRLHGQAYHTLRQQILNARERFQSTSGGMVGDGNRGNVMKRNVNGIQYSTFREAAIAAGYLQDDEEYRRCLEDARRMSIPSQMRALFAVRDKNKLNILLPRGENRTSNIAYQEMLQ
ncbi:hypothetical protein Aduo_001940 [Ancylostoma duodenale]